MELIFNRTLNTLKEIQDIYADARANKIVLKNSQLEFYKEYFVSYDMVTRWIEHGSILANNLKLLGYPSIVIGWGGSSTNAVMQSSVEGDVRHVEIQNEDGEGKMVHENPVQRVLEGCITAIEYVQHINFDFYKSVWNSYQEKYPDMWGDLPETLYPRWVDKGYADFLTILDINWLEANLYIANIIVNQIMANAIQTAHAGDIYCGEESIYA